MSKVPLLTKGQEVKLARRIQLGERKIHILLRKCSAAMEGIDRLDHELEKGEINPWEAARYREEITIEEYVLRFFSNEFLKEREVMP